MCCLRLSPVLLQFSVAAVVAFVADDAAPLSAADV
jgi:hypothetical protein